MKETIFVKMFPSAPSKVHKRLTHAERAGLVLDALLTAPGGKQIVKLIAEGHISITEYDKTALRSELVADAARGRLEKKAAGK